MIVLLNFYYAAKPADVATKKCEKLVSGAQGFHRIEIRSAPGARPLPVVVKMWLASTTLCIATFSTVAGISLFRHPFSSIKTA